jgi:hypothetical protein
MGWLLKILVAMLVIVGGVFAQMAESGTAGPLRWNISGNTLTISGNGAMPDYKIQCCEYGIIGSCWSTSPWGGGSCFVNIVVQEGVTSIGDAAFAFGLGFDHTFNFCEFERSIPEMMSITIGSSVTRIGNNAFDSKRLESIIIHAKTPPQIGMQKLEEVYINPANVTLYVPAGSVEKYRSAPIWRDFNIRAISAFAQINSERVGSAENLWRQSGLRWNISGKTLTISGAGAIPDFNIIRETWSSDTPWNNSRNSITNVIIGDSVTSIGRFAFLGITNLDSITIGNSVTNISSCFLQSPNGSLASINIGSQNTAFSSQDGVLFNRNKTSLIWFPPGRQGGYTIPNSVLNIEEGAFWWPSNLTSITIPSSVRTIDESAFGHLGNLTGFNVCSQNSAFSSEDGVLFNKAKTVLIQYPSNKTDASYTIPNSVLTIRNMAFSNCKNLTEINVGSQNAMFSSENGVLFNKQKTTLIRYPAGRQGAYTIPNSVITIGDRAFGDSEKLTSLYIPNSVNSIGHGAFSNCRGLTEIVNLAKTPQTPPQGIINWSSSTFLNVNEANITLRVLPESINAYVANGWTNFRIEAIDVAELQKIQEEQRRVQDSIAQEQRRAQAEQRKRDSIQTEEFRIRNEERRRERDVREWQERISVPNLRRLVLRNDRGNTSIFEIGRPFAEQRNFTHEGKRVEFRRSGRIYEVYVNGTLLITFDIRFRGSALVDGITIHNKSELGFGIWDVKRLKEN